MTASGTEPLPAWLAPLPGAAAQRALDSWAIEQRGIPGIELMERAGAGLADVVVRHVPEGPIAVVCGGGNNGGDGLVVARLLRDAGREVDVLLLGSPHELAGDARTNLERLPGAPPRPFVAGALWEVAGIVDAVLGTGASGAPRGAGLPAVEAMAAAAADGVPVVRVRRAERRRRLDRRGRGSRRARGRDGDVPCRQAGPLDRPRQAARR